jgi:glycosyltransferase involved in cell wall biosynthesis
VSILAPAKDEAESLPQLVAEVATAMATVPSGADRPRSWQLLLIDDGSTDRTWEVISELAAGDPHVQGLRLRRNVGKSAALAAGVAASRGAVVVTLDADLQDDPAEIPRLLARLDAGADLVAGHKVDRRDPLGKRVPSWVFNTVTSVVTGLRLNDHNCGLKAGRREVFTTTPLYGEMHRYLAAISHAHGFRVVEQPVNHRPRRHGRSKFGLERYARGGLDLLTVVTLTRYHRRPAHLFGGLGLVLGTLGLAILLYLTGVWAFTDQPIGDRPLLLLGVLLLVVAIQLASVGLLAELFVHRQVAEEDPLRHVTAVVHHPVPADQAGEQRQREVPDGVDHPQDDGRRGRAGQPEQR